MNKILNIIFLFTSLSIFCQTTYEINRFSEKYYGKLTIDDGYENDVFKKGTISILTSKDNEEIINIKSDQLTFDIDENGAIKTNISELLYGEQSILMYQDFNFDGQKDLAIMDGQFSCYHGPSFQVYLEDNDSLVHSPEFTELAQEYCGMFEVDYENKKIKTMTKSGCCWHQYSEFEVQDKKPIPVKIIESSLGEDGVTADYIEKNRVDNQFVETKYSYLAGGADIIEFYSMTFKNRKKMEIYRVFAFDDYLIYVFTDKDEKIELLYSGDFIYDKNKNTLTFENGDVTYQVYSEGIIVNTPKKQIDLKAVSIGENVTLLSLLDLSVKNLSIK